MLPRSPGFVQSNLYSSLYICVRLFREEVHRSDCKTHASLLIRQTLRHQTLIVLALPFSSIFNLHTHNFCNTHASYSCNAFISYFYNPHTSDYSNLCVSDSSNPNTLSTCIKPFQFTYIGLFQSVYHRLFQSTYLQTHIHKTILIHIHLTVPTLKLQTVILHMNKPAVQAADADPS